MRWVPYTVVATLAGALALGMAWLATQAGAPGAVGSRSGSEPPAEAYSASSEAADPLTVAQPGPGLDSDAGAPATADAQAGADEVLSGGIDESGRATGLSKAQGGVIPSLDAEGAAGATAEDRARLTIEVFGKPAEKKKADSGGSSGEGRS